MINNLNEKYRNLGSSYYGIPISSLFCIADEFSKKSCLDFIKQHYNQGCKKEALTLAFQQAYEEKGKHQHTVALYLLGLHLKGLFDDVLRDRISGLMPDRDNGTVQDPDENSVRSCSWYDFRYTWFLTCLYHDTASCIESLPNWQWLTERRKTLDFYLGTFNIKSTPFNYTPLRPGISLTRYSEFLVKNYFYYRMDHHHSLDHGILGGYLLFDKMYRNFKEKTKDVVWNQNQAGKIIEGLNYRPEHLDHFAYIADAIICHNLWTANELSANIDTYKAYGLEPLIVDGSRQDRKLNIDDYPLQFLLCLLDSIEPVKRFIEDDKKDENPELSMSAADVLANFCINPEGNTIQIDWCKCLEKQKTARFQKWLKSVCDLGTWMDVSVEQKKEKKPSVTITINRR